MYFAHRASRERIKVRRAVRTHLAYAPGESAGPFSYSDRTASVASDATRPWRTPLPSLLLSLLDPGLDSLVERRAERLVVILVLPLACSSPFDSLA